MARKSQYRLGEKGAELSDLLDSVESLLERTKVMYEQYFMGIQKMAPSQLHRDVERKIRELTQQQIRNTALRYRLTTITQKFGVYNTYWRRTMRQIEQGTYVRDIARVSRRAQARGEDVPEEILMAMPRRMRDRILRDRQRLSRGAGEEVSDAGAGNAGAGDAGAGDAGGGEDRSVRRTEPGNVHRIDAGLLDSDDLGADLDEIFRNLTSEAEKAVDAHTSPGPSTPPVPRSSTPPRAVTPPPVRAGTPPPVPGRAATPPPVRAATPPPVPGRAATPPPVRAGTPPPVRASALPPGMTEGKTRDLYNRYVEARRSVGASTNVPYEKLVESLRSQAPKIMQQHKARGVEFDVVVKDDKVLLKAKPKP